MYAPYLDTNYCLAVSRHLSAALISQLQVWYLHWLVSVQSVGDLHSCVNTSCLTETLLRSSKHISVWMKSTQDKVVHIPVQQHQLDCHKYRGLRACRSIHRVSIHPCCALWLLSTPNNALLFVTRNHAMKCLWAFLLALYMSGIVTRAIHYTCIWRRQCTCRQQNRIAEAH